MTMTDSKLHIAFIIIVYVCCYGVFSLVNIPLWDDWVLIGHKADGLWEMFSQLGRREQYLLVLPFSFMAIPIAWATANFVCWGIVAVSIYGLLRGVGWTAANAFWAALLTAAFPLNQARFALAVLPYSVSATFFALALLLLVTSIDRGNFWFRILAAPLLLLSFTTNSFLTLSPLAIVVVFLALRKHEQQTGFWRAALRTTTYAELFALPFLYWIAKTSLQPAYGIYAKYNQFQMNPLSGLLEAIWALPLQLAGLRFIFPNADFLMEASCIAVICTGFIILCGGLMRVNFKTARKTALAASMNAIALLGMAILAFFPYVMVGLHPSFAGLWESRHQTTLAVIAGTIAFSVLNAILPARIVPACCALLICIFMAMDISVSRQLMADVIDSSALIYAPQVAAIPENTLVAVHADNKTYRMMGRTLRFYELSAMLNMHAPEHKIMAMLASEAVGTGTHSTAPLGTDTLAAGISAKCATWVHHPEYGFGEIGEHDQFAELWLTPKLQPPSYWEGLKTTIGLLFKWRAAIDKAVARLDVQIRIHPDVTAGCARQTGD